MDILLIITPLINCEAMNKFLKVKVKKIKS
jgi:hypothetical protein